MPDAKLLQFGSQGEDVKKLQSQLRNWGFPLDPKKPLEVTGTFDQRTLEAVKEFQEFHLLPPSGKVDSQTAQIIWMPRVEALLRLVRLGCNRGDFRGVDALIKLGEKAKEAVPTLIAILLDEKADEGSCEGAFEALVGLGSVAKEAVNPLLQYIQNNNGMKIWQAVSIVGCMGLYPEKVVPVLLMKLEDKQDKSRPISEIITALGHFGSQAKAAIPTLIALLSKRNYQNLGLEGELEGAPTWPTHAGESTYARDAAFALAHIGSDAVEPLIQALKDPDDKARYGAAFALGNISPIANDAIDDLTMVMNTDTNPDVRWMATVALENMNLNEGGYDGFEDFYSKNCRPSLVTLQSIECPLEWKFDPYTGRCLPEWLGSFGQWLNRYMSIFWRRR